MSLTLLTAGVGLVTSIFSNWMDNKKIKQQGKLEITQAKIEAKKRMIDNQFQMDANAADDMRYSWKDEFLVLLLSIPVVMCFVPGLAPYVTKGFEVLKDTPEWYQYSFLGIIAATFGLRAWFNNFKK